VSAIGGRTSGYGFSIINRHRAPLLDFTYETAAEAEAARDLMEAVLTGIVDLISHPDPGRFHDPHHQ
jgi:hypothetical protein